MTDSGDTQGFNREAYLSPGLSAPVNLWFYQLGTTGSFYLDRWQSISVQPLSGTSLRSLGMPGLIGVKPGVNKD